MTTSPFETSPFRARTDDGVELRGDWLVPPRPAAVAVTLHAMMVSRRTMDRPAGKGLASALAEGGLAVANVDFRAHGESGPRVSEGGLATYDDFVVHDIPAAIGAARAAFPGRAPSRRSRTRRAAPASCSRRAATSSSAPP